MTGPRLAALAPTLLASLALTLPGAAPAHELASEGAPSPQALPASCPTSTDGDDPIAPDEVITGEFGSGLQGSYVMVPFDVPAGTDAVRVKYCHDQPDAPSSSQIKHTLDLGLWEARPGPGTPWGREQFRGWGGSSHPDVTVSPNGFSSEAEYLDAPRLHRRGHTTRGFLPGPIPAGEWAVELGVAAVANQLQGDLDGKVAWRVEVDLIDSSDYTDQPYQQAPYDSAAADPGPGWFTGDLHVHAEHSSLGDATMTEAFDYAFDGPPDGAGLDFITLSDYVTSSAWGEVGRYQGDHPGKLIARSSEVITYRGHANNHVSLSYADHRTGPVHELGSGGALTELRPATPASQVFDQIHAAGGFTQINHPTIFPSAIPVFTFLCRGCPWDHPGNETDYSKVDAIEVATGPAGVGDALGPNPFTLTAIQFYEQALATGAKIAAVGSSDSHNAGRTPGGVTQSPIGQASTVVYAPELSEAGIRSGVKAGHTFVKVWGPNGPDLRFEAEDPGSPDPAIMGDTVEADDGTTFTARVIGAGPSAPRPGVQMLSVIKDGAVSLTVPIAVDDFSYSFDSSGPGRYRLQVDRLITGGASVEAVSSPIYLEGEVPADGAAGPCSNRIRGTRGRDRLRGTKEGDRMLGLRGADRLSGLAGRDCLRGHRGPDRLRGGPGKDSIRGGPGRDRIMAADGQVDRIRCGFGRDRAIADRADRLSGCELVRRRPRGRKQR